MSVDVMHAPAPADEQPPEDDEYVGDWSGREPDWFGEQRQKLGALDDKPPPEDYELEVGEDWVDPNPPMTDAEVIELLGPGAHRDKDGYWLRAPLTREPFDPGPDYANVSERGERDAYVDAEINWPAFWNEDLTARHYLLEPLAPRGRAVTIVSKAKEGKSELALFCAVQLARGLKA
ncbi:MAG: hypothetical protein M3046_06665, partial [Actinomycetota bacterium]|nr:hypothetical protein [Actinomycetota bacterium]